MAFVVQAVVEAAKRFPGLGGVGTLAIDVAAGGQPVALDDAGDLTAEALSRRISEARTPAPAGFLLAESASDAVIVSAPDLGGRPAVLTVGAVVPRPVVVQHERAGDTIAVRRTAYLTLVHSPSVDGAAATGFLTTVRDQLQVRRS
jgi:pyruvate/2-oxoglutarate dehydrogenase complex dihydrolipoamide acyltransferase (E2) component